MHQRELMGDWDAPFPLIDISAISAIVTSVDIYNREHGLTSLVPALNGGTPNPLYDAEATLVAYLF